MKSRESPEDSSLEAAVPLYKAEMVVFEPENPLEELKISAGCLRTLMEPQ
jgi:hypothetical protein